jgi:hypothetical protein
MVWSAALNLDVDISCYYFQWFSILIYDQHQGIMPLIVYCSCVFFVKALFYRQFIFSIQAVSILVSSYSGNVPISLLALGLSILPVYETFL